MLERRALQELEVLLGETIPLVTKDKLAQENIGILIDDDVVTALVLRDCHLDTLPVLPQVW